MADVNNIVPENVPGDFFIDTTCMGCGNCRDIAPELFAQSGRYYSVKRQPETAEEQLSALEALVCCPKGAIGTIVKNQRDTKMVIDSYPKLIEDNVYYCGFNSQRSAGGKSYIVLHQNGNWMIDSPKFSPRLVKWLHSNGGLKYIFLTHRDDVAEASDYAREFAARRIIHRDDLEAEPNAEIVLDGCEAKLLANDFCIIPTPGHTPGHCMLLYKEKLLFTGDMLTSKVRFNQGLEIHPAFYCWWSWDKQTESIERLKKYRFSHTLPAHGISHSCTAEEMQHNLDLVLEQCRNEPDADPCTEDRIAFFKMIADHSEVTGQPKWAAMMNRRVQSLKARTAAASE